MLATGLENGKFQAASRRESALEDRARRAPDDVGAGDAEVSATDAPSGPLIEDTGARREDSVTIAPGRAFG